MLLKQDKSETIMKNRKFSLLQLLIEGIVSFLKLMRGKCVFFCSPQQEKVLSGTVEVTWENSSQGFAFFPLNSVKWTKRIFIEKCRSNTVCEMRVAWVWLLRKASAGYCLPSQLLQAPAPWLPYMRDQGLPRCSRERRAQCEMGQTAPQNTHFLLRVRCPSGDSDGVSDTSHPPFVLNGICCLFQGLVNTIWQYSAP